MNHLTQSELDALVEKATSKKHIHGAVFHVETVDGTTVLTSAAGNLKPGDPFYLASINKLFLSAITLRLIRDNQLNLSDKIATYLPAEWMKGLHMYKGHDYSNDITIAHLLSQTSGLPCYLIDKRPGAPKLMDELLQGIDQEWPTERVIEQVKKMKTKFPPGQKGKASYGNTNFRLLGKILENVIGEPLHVILTRLFQELRMSHTYVFTLDEKRTFAPVYAHANAVSIPRYFASSQFDIISTAQDLMIFLKAFYEGYFYPLEKLKSLEQWNSIFFPFKYGIGVQMFYTPWLLSPFRPIPSMLGHCGSVGTAAFYIPQKKVFITGTINQAKSPSTLFQTLIKILNKL